MISTLRIEILAGAAVESSFVSAGVGVVGILLADPSTLGAGLKERHSHRNRQKEGEANRHEGDFVGLAAG